jgi:hypothetical protein
VSLASSGSKDFDATYDKPSRRRRFTLNTTDEDSTDG